MCFSIHTSLTSVDWKTRLRFDAGVLDLALGRGIVSPPLGFVICVASLHLYELHPPLFGLLPSHIHLLFTVHQRQYTLCTLFLLAGSDDGHQATCASPSLRLSSHQRRRTLLSVRSFISLHYRCFLLANSLFAYAVQPIAFDQGFSQRLHGCGGGEVCRAATDRRVRRLDKEVSQSQA